MYRIDNETAVNIMPAPAADGPNPDSFFTHGSAEDGIPATIVEQDWANAVQEELCYVIEQAGLTLSKSTHTQLLQAIKLISQGNTSSYTTSTTAANTYTATLSPAPAAYTTGMLAYIKFTNANTGAATINLNGLGAKDINRVDGSALNAGDIAATMIAILMYDGTNFQLLNAPTSPVALQNSLYVYADDTGSANAYAVTLAPAITSYVKGLRLISKIANTNTAASTLNVNALGTKAIQRPNGDALVGNELVTGQMAEFVYDGTQFRLVNPANDATQPKIQNNSYSYAADSGSANTYAVALTPAITSYVTGLIVRTTIANGNSGASTLNVNSLGTKNILLLNGDALVGGELITGMIAQLFYDGTQFRLLNPSTVNGRLLNVQVFTTSGTYTPTLGTKKAFVECWGGGGGGGGNTNGSFAGGGGGGGAYSADLISISGTATITVGAGGAGAAGSDRAARGAR